ncbi:MAG: replication-associated recombination protein A [Spirochaetes bacterium]|nr:MAG: replication-associated recombination protein A [Spirochaetota bacterium]
MDGLFKGPSPPLSRLLMPQTLEDFFGQDHLVGKNGIIRKMVDEDNLISSVFYGPPGCGKTALAKIIARSTKSEIIQLNAVTATVDDIRKSIKKARSNSDVGIKTIVFIDEIHRFNKLQQDALLPPLEEGQIILIGVTTKNPFFSLTPPLRSRVLLFEFYKLSEKNLYKILEKAIKKVNLEISYKAKNYLVKISNGDARRMLNILEAATILVKGRKIEREDLDKIIKKQWILYDRDEDFHYDVISAFIKSIRGSNPDAALYWLAVMLEGGEDPLYIARRLIILASEDIGLADSLALLLTTSAYEAVDNIGMPEARIILSHITIYLSLQQKSNSSYLAIEKALKYVREKPLMDVPPYLKAVGSEKKLYKYPHDYQGHFIKQKYLPKSINFYQPTEIGREKDLKKRYEKLKEMLKDEDRKEPSQE